MAPGFVLGIDPARDQTQCLHELRPGREQRLAPRQLKSPLRMRVGLPGNPLELPRAFRERNPEIVRAFGRRFDSADLARARQRFLRYDEWLVGRARPFLRLGSPGELDDQGRMGIGRRLATFVRRLQRGRGQEARLSCRALPATQRPVRGRLARGFRRSVLRRRRAGRPRDPRLVDDPGKRRRDGPRRRGRSRRDRPRRSRPCPRDLVGQQPGSGGVGGSSRRIRRLVEARPTAASRVPRRPHPADGADKQGDDQGGDHEVGPDGQAAIHRFFRERLRLGRSRRRVHPVFRLSDRSTVLSTGAEQNRAGWNGRADPRLKPPLQLLQPSRPIAAARAQRPHDPHDPHRPDDRAPRRPHRLDGPTPHPIG